MRPALLVHLASARSGCGAIALAIVGWVLQLLALGKAPLTLVQPVLALGLFLLLALGVEAPRRARWGARVGGASR